MKESPKSHGSSSKSQAPSSSKQHEAPKAKTPTPAPVAAPKSKTPPAFVLDDAQIAKWKESTEPYVLSESDEAEKTKWWASLTEANRHELLKQANKLFSGVTVAHVWRLFQADRITLPE